MSVRHCDLPLVRVRGGKVAVRQCAVRVRQSELSVVRVRQSVRVRGGKEQDRMVAKGCEGDWEWKTEKVNIHQTTQASFKLMIRNPPQ